ncbi:transglycosylase SLT domain-containing protein [Pseudaquabacterium rugosum]|uniref:Transglycosylase SLT domain-containing protein n=1 Tax=Pseudaquabacterium rugosum TaxID=2984194 RepID=A0ABU9BEV0_9BURK
MSQPPHPCSLEAGRPSTTTTGHRDGWRLRALVLALSAGLGACAPLAELTPAPERSAAYLTPSRAAPPPAPATAPAVDAEGRTAVAPAPVARARGAAGQGERLAPPWDSPDAGRLSGGVAASAQPATRTAEPAMAGAPLALDALQPDAALDLDSAAAESDLWARVRQRFAIADQDDALVRKWEQWYAGRPDYVSRMTERGGRYLYHVMGEVERRGMPAELALLPFIESAFNPRAMSTAKASGMWQFVPATGRDFDLRQNLFRDDRRDVLASTRAALDYLGRLHQMFGDWRLALAAYNWGQGNVQRAIKRNQEAGLPTDYLSLRMPEETRNYYPKLQAVKNIVSRPQDFGLELAALRNHPYFVSVAIERDIDIELAARFAQLPLDEFQHLNPQMNKPVILAAGTPQVLLPYDNANAFVKAMSAHRGALATWTAWVAPKTMKTADAAHEVGMSEERLREVNAIPPRMLVKSGSVLLVPRDPRRGRDVTEEVADNAALALAPDIPPVKRVRFVAGRKGDTVQAVAKRYRLNAEQVARWNNTRINGRFARGTTVTVLVPANAPLPVATARRDDDADDRRTSARDKARDSRSAALAAREARDAREDRRGANAKGTRRVADAAGRSGGREASEPRRKIAAGKGSARETARAARPRATEVASRRDATKAKTPTNTAQRRAEAQDKPQRTRVAHN